MMVFQKMFQILSHYCLVSKLVFGGVDSNTPRRVKYTKVSCKLERSPSQRSHPPRPGEPGANALEMESGWKNVPMVPGEWY